MNGTGFLLVHMVKNASINGLEARSTYARSFYDAAFYLRLGISPTRFFAIASNRYFMYKRLRFEPVKLGEDALFMYSLVPRIKRAWCSRRVKYHYRKGNPMSAVARLSGNSVTVDAVRSRIEYLEHEAALFRDLYLGRHPEKYVDACADRMAIDFKYHVRTSSEVRAVVFALVLAAASMRIRLSSPVLSFCGRHLFGIYVFQRLPMWVFKGTAIASNRYVYFLSCLGATIAISVVFDMAFSWLWKIAASRFRTRKSLPAGSGDNRAVAEVPGTKIAENGKKPLYVKPAGREWNGWSIMDDRKLTVDMICSLGGDCIAASQQKLRGLRPYALPFDWCFADGETAVVNLARQLRCRFAGMALKENLRPIQGIKNGYKDIATGYNFIHHFQSAIEEPGEYERFREVFDRRVNRLVEGIERSSEILFIVSRVYRLHTGCLREFGKVCYELWPGKRFHFILATYNSNESVVQHDGEMMVVRIARDRTSYDVKEKVFEWSFLDNVKLR